MVTLVILGVAAVLSFVSLKNTYYLFSVLAGCGWVGLGVWWLASPFTTQGSPADTVLLMVVFFAGVAFFFKPFWASKFGANGQEVGGRWRLPFGKTDEEEQAELQNERSAPTMRQRNEVYQSRLDAASRGERRRQ